MKLKTSDAIALKVDRIIKLYEGKVLLDKLSFMVNSKEIVCLLGPSGSGKSTLLRIIAGLEPFESGHITWHGKDLDNKPTELRSFGLMFQDYALFPHLNVFENVAFGLRIQHLSESLIAQKVHQALERVSMGGFAKRKVQNLSGGEQQRIALARTLAPEPKLIMLDEPLGALDRKLREELTQEIRQILRTTGVPSIYVTHDQDEAFTLADRILVLFNGKIAQEGSPEELYRYPESSWVANFLGLGNVFKGKVLSNRPLFVQTILGDIECHPQARQQKVGTYINLLLRPEGVGVTKTGKNKFTGTVKDCIFQGDHYRTMVDVCGNMFIFNLIGKYPQGSQVTLYIKDENVYSIGSE